MGLSTLLSPPSKINVESASFSLEGPKGQNDDRTLEPVVCTGGWIAAIADGVGGNAGGGRAAEIALDTLRSAAKSSTISFGELFDEACQQMRAEAQARPDWSHMATTLSALWVSGNEAVVGHVGDSRVYHIRGKGVVTRTKDQTEVAELLRQNVLTPAQAKRYPRRNVILSYLGPDASFELDQSKFTVESGDTIVLLTDGVYGEIKKAELAELHTRTATLKEFTTAVRDQLKTAGVRDDSSLVAIRI